MRFLIYDEPVNSNKYLNKIRLMVTDFLNNQLLEDYRICWFELNGPRLLHWRSNNGIIQMCEYRLFRRLGPSNWSETSPDITTHDFSTTDLCSSLDLIVCLYRFSS